MVENNKQQVGYYLAFGYFAIILGKISFCMDYIGNIY